MTNWWQKDAKFWEIDAKYWQILINIMINNEKKKFNKYCKICAKICKQTTNIMTKVQNINTNNLSFVFVLSAAQLLLEWLDD